MHFVFLAIAFPMTANGSGAGRRQSIQDLLNSSILYYSRIAAKRIQKSRTI
jgi:hypothetical protein